MIDTYHHQVCARTLSDITCNWFVKPKRVPQQFDFTTQLCFVWSMNLLWQHKWLTLPITSYVHDPHLTSYPTDLWSQNTLCVTFWFQNTGVFCLVNEFAMAAQTIDIYHHQLCALTSSNIMFNWSMKPKRVPQQFDFTIQLCFVWWMSLGWQHKWLTLTSPALCTNLIQHHIQPIYEDRTHFTTRASSNTKCLCFLEHSFVSMWN